MVLQVIGRKRCPIVDTWWQTETGQIMIAPLAGLIATKPGSATLHCRASRRRWWIRTATSWPKARGCW